MLSNGGGGNSSSSALCIGRWCAGLQLMIVIGHLVLSGSGSPQGHLLFRRGRS